MGSGDAKGFTEQSIISTLDRLRISSMSVSNKPFDEIAEEVWEELGLEIEESSKSELKESAKSALFENLLISVIEGIYNEQSTSPTVGKKDSKREAAINHDISLLMFGLLDGYYHTENSQGVKQLIDSSIRYRKYLETSAYVKLEYAGEGTYTEIAKKDQLEHPGKQPRPLNHITKIAGICKVEIASKLFYLITTDGYKAYLRIANFDKQTGQRTDLPKPYFTLENYTPRTSSGKMFIPPEPDPPEPDPPEPDPPEPDPPEPDPPEPDPPPPDPPEPDPPPPDPQVLVVVIFAFLLLAVLLTQQNRPASTERKHIVDYEEPFSVQSAASTPDDIKDITSVPHVEDIYVSTQSLVFGPDKKAIPLPVLPMPLEVQDAPLNYISCNTDIVCITKTGYLMLSCEMQDGESRTVTITIQAENGFEINQEFTIYYSEKASEIPDPVDGGDF